MPSNVLVIFSPRGLHLIAAVAHYIYMCNQQLHVLYKPFATGLSKPRSHQHSTMLSLPALLALFLSASSIVRKCHVRAIPLGGLLVRQDQCEGNTAVEEAIECLADSPTNFGCYNGLCKDVLVCATCHILT